VPGCPHRIQWIAVSAERAGNETVGGWIGCGGEQEAVHEDRARYFIHLVFHRGTLRDFDDDENIVRWGTAGGYL
jgi:hypothetical protein